MTPNGLQTLRAMVRCEEDSQQGRKKFTAEEIAEHFDGLPDRRNPVMTISSYLTHLKRSGHVRREASSDKTIAWWDMTTKGRKAIEKELAHATEGR